MCNYALVGGGPSASHWIVLLLVVGTAFSVLGLSAKATSAFGLDGMRPLRYWKVLQNGGLSREQPPSRPEQIWDNPLLRPAFDNTTRTNIVTSTGRVAYLHCRVNHLGNRVVTWLRKRDAHVLTVGLFSYTTDQRFTALHSEGSPDWVLKITSPQPRDSGTYECQVSTEPKISKSFILNVVESLAMIEGSSDIHMSAGNTLNLTCSTTVPADLPSYFYWYHNGEVVQYSGKKDVAVHTRDGRSRLVVVDVGPQHSGNYTCAPENAVPATVTVYVLRAGEHPAAMQRGESSTAVPRTSFLLLLAICSAFIVLAR
ncbi:neurotrimin-like isoform X1 [Panulirus ornatus]|uniref:neurotrimin-like isoform X1 n=2 Tax=Panulirus ornatus TaxID=150431 RepID=UPI003A889459